MADPFQEELDQAPGAPPPPVLPGNGTTAEETAPDAILRDPAPKVGKLPKTKAHNQAYFRGQLDRIFPSAVKVKFWKRSAEGRLRALPRTYSPQDLLRSTDIEEFVATYLVPTYGDGDYEVALVTGDGKVSDAASVSVLSPEGAADTSETKVLGGMLNRLMDRMDRIEAGTGVAPPTPDRPKSLLEQLNEVEEVSKKLGGGGGGEGGMNPLVMLMLMNHQQQQQPHPPARDLEMAEMRREMRRLAEMLDGRGRHEPTGPSLPPDFFARPEPSEGTSAKDIVDAAERIAKIAVPAQTTIPAQPKSAMEQADELLSVVTKAKAAFGLGEEPRWAQALAESLKVQKPERKEGLAGLVDDIGTFKKAMEVMGVAPGGGGDFGDKLIQALDITTSPERIEAFGKLVDRMRGTASTDKMPSTGDGERKKASFPAGFQKYVDAMQSAADERSLVESTMRSLEFLGKHTAWQPYVLRMLQTAKSENREEVMKYVKAYLTGLTKAGKIQQATGQKALAAFNTHVDAVIATVNRASQPKEE